MKVKFIRQFFGPNGSRYRTGTVHTIPDDWANRLPKGTEIVEEPAGTPEMKGFDSFSIPTAGKPVKV